MASSDNLCMEIRNPRKKRQLIKPNNLASASWVEACDDILTEILCRLPWKSLKRFECVSKHWLNLINSPEFIQPLLPKKDDPDVLVGLFYQYYPNRKLQVKFAAINMRVKALSCLDFRFSFLPCRTICILGCQYGLILCSTSRRSSCYYVCNPITKQYVGLPRIEVSSKKLNFRFIGLYVEKESGHFQVVVIPSISVIKSEPVQIFSSMTGTWKKIASSKHSEGAHNFLYSYGCQGVQAGQSLYWLHPNWNFVVYDIETEKVSVFRIPQHGNEICWHSCASRGRLGEIDGKLRYIFSGDLPETTIWELREGWWHPVRHVDTSAIIRTLSAKINSSDSMHKSFLTPIGFNCSDPDVVFFKLGPKVFSYNFETEAAQLLMDDDLECVSHGAFLYHLPQYHSAFKKEEKKKKRKGNITQVVVLSSYARSST